MDDLLGLSRRLIGYDTSVPSGVQEATGFLKGWLEARGISVRQEECRGLPVLTAQVGDPADPALIFHGHIDVVPAADRQFSPRIDGDRLIGRGSYDMKAALAAMMLALPDPADPLPGIRVVLAIVADEESEESENRGSEYLVRRGLRGEFAITGEPTDMHVGVAAKGVLALRLGIAGRAAHGSTPWLGSNAILNAVKLFEELESLPFAAESSELFDRPSINLGRIWGGDAINKVPDYCAIDVDIRYLPHQDPALINDQISELGPARMETIFELPPIRNTDSPWVSRLLTAAAEYHHGAPAPVGRDGASDAVSFIRVGVPAVEFGPVGAGHHGPDEWVSISSLHAYLGALRDFLSKSSCVDREESRRREESRSGERSDD